MMDIEAIHKISETKAFNGRYGKSQDVAGLTFGHRARSMGRWGIKQSKKSNPLSSNFRWANFRWAKSYLPK